jgi:hypothetical protein
MIRHSANAMSIALRLPALATDCELHRKQSTSLRQHRLRLKLEHSGSLHRFARRGQ